MLSLQKRKIFKILEISSILVGVIMALYYFYPVLASPPSTPYAPGETTNPTCAPGDTNCTVYPPLTTTLTTSTTMTMGSSSLNFDSGTFFIDAENGRVGIGTTTPSILFSINGNAGLFNQGALRLYETAANGVNFIAFIATTSLAGNSSYYFPGDGASSQILSTDGNGNLYWATSTGSGTVNSGTSGQIAIYASNGTAVSGTSTILVTDTTTTISSKLRITANSYFDTIASGTWNGAIVGILYGGTNSSTIAANGSVIYSDGVGYNASAVGVSGQLLQSAGSGVPVWVSTSTMGFVNLQGATSGTQQTGHFNISGTGLFGASVGIGTTTPQAKLTIQGDGTANPFSIVTSTAGAASMLTVLTNGNVGINSSTPSTKLAVEGTSYFSQTSTFGGNIVNTIDSNTVILQKTTVAVSSNPTSIFVSGHYAYTADNGTPSMSVFDISNPLFPVQKGTVSVGSLPWSVYVSGRYAYVTNQGGNSLSVIDISNPAAPLQIATTSVGAAPRGLYVSGRYAYTTNYNDNNMSVVDISNPLVPRQIAAVSVGSQPISVYVSGRYAYVANNGGNSISIVDISNPSTPVSVTTVNTGLAPRGVYVSGRYAYVTNFTSNTISVIDISNPASPVRTGFTSVGMGPRGIYVSGRYAFVANQTSSTISIVDISSSTNPVQIVTTSVGAGPYSVYVSGRYVYVANNTDSTLSVVDISGTEVTSIVAHSAEVGNLQSRNDIFAQGNIMAGTSLLVGAGGIQSQGALSVFASSTGATSSIFDISSAQTSNIFKVFANGRVGIGTSTPLARLFVQGAGTENPFSIVSSTAAAESMFTVLTNGNVGINSSSPYATLSVQGDLAVSAGIYDSNATRGSNGQLLQTNGTVITWVSTSSLGLGGGSGTVNSGTAGQFAYYDTTAAIISGTSTLFILPSRLIGIGTTTPAAKLTIQGDGTANPFSIVSSTAAAGSMFTVLTNGNVGINSSSPIASLSVQGVGTVNPLSIVSSTGASLLSILTNGNVLINTTTVNSSTLFIQQIAATTGTPQILTLTGGAHTALNGGEDTDVMFNLSAVKEFFPGSGNQTIATNRDFRILARTLNKNAGTNALTITDSATVSISGSPTAGTGVTLTRSAALRLEAGQLYLPLGTASLPAITWVGGAGSLNTGIYLGAQSPDKIAFTFEGTASGFMDSSGYNSGLPSGAGTTLFGAAVITQTTAVPLTIKGGLAASTANTDIIIKSAATRTAGNIFSIQNNTATTTVINYLGMMGINSSTPSAMLSIVGTTTKDLIIIASSTGADLFHILTNGNVGINSSSPISTLSVQGRGGANPFTVVSSTGASLFTVLTNGNVGIGTTTPVSRLSVVGVGNTSSTIAFNTYSNSGTSTFKVDNAGNVAMGDDSFYYEASSTISYINSIETGALNFVDDAGIVTWVELSVTASSTTGTAHSYTASIDENAMILVYAESNGSGGIQNQTVSINTSTTSTYKLYIDAGVSTTAALGVNGFVKATGYITGSTTLDIAETYPVDPECDAKGSCPIVGDVVCSNEDASSTFYIEKCSTTSADRIVGVVSGNPGFILGGYNVSDSKIKGLYPTSYRPIALGGRVSVNVSTINGPIKAGDYLTSSDVPGLAVKALEPGKSIGMALQSFGTSPSYQPARLDDASRSGGEGAVGVAEVVATGTITVFVNTSWSPGSPSFQEGVGGVAEADIMPNFATVVLDKFTLAVKNSLRKLGLLIKNGIATVKEVFADKVTTKQLCVGSTCVNEQQLQEILDKTDTQASVTSPSYQPARLDDASRSGGEGAGGVAGGSNGNAANIIESPSELNTSTPLAPDTTASTTSSDINTSTL